MKRSGIAAVSAAVALASTAATPATAATRDIDGIWQSVGYGTAFVANGNTLRTYETTGSSCLPGATYTKKSATRYTDKDGDAETIKLTRGNSAELTPGGSVGHWTLHRQQHLPRQCRKKQPPLTPRRTFDVFWQTFAENYPFFPAKHTDWRRLRDRVRPTITDDTTDQQLYKTLCHMVTPLHDNHIYLTKSGQPPCYSVRPGTVEPNPDLDQKATTLIEKNDLHRTMRTWGQGRIGYADLPGHRGYLRISGFAGYTKTDTYQTNRAELTSALNAIFTAGRVESLKGLIIDVRLNGGGDDALGLQVASRISQRPYFAYAKRTQTAPNHFTRPQPIRVMPAPGKAYTGPVAVLTGGSDVSAGETFVQSLIDRPRTIRIGQNTQGVFSDILERALPNGWQFGLPNEEFLTKQGRTFDGTGIPPQVRTPVFTKAEFAGGKDSAFDAAIRILSGTT